MGSTYTLVCHRFLRSNILLLLVWTLTPTVEHDSTVALLVREQYFFLNFEKQCKWIKLIHSHCSHEIFFKKKKISAINWFHLHYSREHEQYFFLFVKKNSLRWIKFTRTVISILFLIIFYLILLLAQKIMKTIVLVEWILYVMKL